MTIAKAKLYKTARLIHDVYSHRAGNIVAIKFLRRGAFGLIFQIGSSLEELKANPTAVSEHDLTDFVL